jgi:folate-dependent tRNA-U54 methylase TrmFO/GidA
MAERAGEDMERSKTSETGNLVTLEVQVNKNQKVSEEPDNAVQKFNGKDSIDFTKETVIGALSHYVNDGAYSANFQPMNANFGIVDPLNYKVKGGKKARNEELAKRSLDVIRKLKGTF